MVGKYVRRIRGVTGNARSVDDALIEISGPFERGIARRLSRWRADNADQPQQVAMSKHDLRTNGVAGGKRPISDFDDFDQLSKEFCPQSLNRA